MLVNQVGSVIGELCACVYACVVVCLYDLLDGILMFFHMMVVIGDRHACFPGLSGMCMD